MRGQRARLACAATVLAAAAAGPARAVPTPCTASISATERGDQTTSEATIKVWGVNIDAPGPCSKVYFDLVVTERLFDGEEITSTVRSSRDVTGQTTTYKVTYRIAPDTKLVDSKFKVARCVVCGTE
jgi:hypothetical protein